MRTVSLSKALTAGSANCIAQSQSVVAGANAIINGTSASAGVFTLDTQRRIIIVSGGDDHLNTVTITGNRQSGQQISETLKLTNGGTAVSVLNYFSGGTITFANSTATTVTIGTNGTGSTDWVVPNFHLDPFSLNVQTEQTGTVTWNLESTNDMNFWDTPSGQATTPQANVYAIANAQTAAVNVIIAQPVTGWRLTVTSGTGTIAAQGLQSGITNY